MGAGAAEVGASASGGRRRGMLAGKIDNFPVDLEHLSPVTVDLNLMEFLPREKLSHEIIRDARLSAPPKIFSSAPNWANSSGRMFSLHFYQLASLLLIFMN